jgi:hypothetical protein
MKYLIHQAFMHHFQIQEVGTLKSIISILFLVLNSLSSCKKAYFLFTSQISHVKTLTKQYFSHKSKGPSKDRFFNVELKTY